MLLLTGLSLLILIPSEPGSPEHADEALAFWRLVGVIDNIESSFASRVDNLLISSSPHMNIPSSTSRLP
jgi:hypothetical protein